MQIRNNITQLTNEMMQSKVTPIHWFYRYCQSQCQDLVIQDIEADLFHQFLLYWLPKESRGMDANKTQFLMKQMEQLCQSIYLQTGKNLPALYLPIQEEMAQELLRTMQMKYELERSLGSPIIGTYPLIIDLAEYKKQQNKKRYNDPGMVFEQGYFEIVDKVEEYGLILKKYWSQERYIKILMDSSIQQHFRKQDILHMRLRRKLFFTSWEIEEIRGYYLPQAQPYFPTKM